ncbi:MAG TPA: cupredoxin domain-containing protein [Candidatus Paceibacterota bacterium]
MNKYVIILIVLAVIVGASIVFKDSLGTNDNKVVATGIVREITIRAKQNEWRFDPDVIEVDQGDTVKLTVINEDDFDHGIQIDAFGVSKRIPANGTVKAEFVVTKSGEFPFFCSVPCGDGDVADGTHRGHFDQKGKIVVRNAIKTQ